MRDYCRVVSTGRPASKCQRITLQSWNDHVNKEKITFLASLSPGLDICCGLSPVPFVTIGELDMSSSEGL